MAGPIGDPPGRGNGIDQFKAIIMGWIRAEIQASRAGGNGLHVDGPTGDLVADRGQFRSGNYVAGVSGWGMKPSGNAEFNDMTIRGGIIGNDALTSPLKAESVYFWTTGFAVPNTGTVFASSTVTVPAGFTSALVTVVSRIAATNSTAATDLLSCVSKINGAGGGSLQHPINPGWMDFNVHAASSVLPGLIPGGTFLLQVHGNTTTAPWAANAANFAVMSGTILWFR